MKALTYYKYGSPEVVHLNEIPTPTPKNDEIQVKVIASSVNRTDAGFRSAEYFVSRFFSGLLRPKLPVLGSEFSGIVSEIGPDVKQFKVGDKVFGFNDKTFGGHAEYLCISENAAVEIIPENIGFEEAAVATEGSHYTLVDIRAAKVKKGDDVLVNGATGAIGSAAVQLLKALGATVTAVGNTKNLELIHSFGADKVVNYEQEDFTKTTDKYDFIFDAVGKSSFGKCKPLLKENGIYISTELGKNGENLLLALTTKFRKKKLLFPIPSITKEDVRFIKSLIEQGKFKPVIDRTYTMDQIVEAYQYVESGQKTGNVVIQISTFAHNNS
jgi:NADPH:quinone reductase-like Zn-dependent oxidoreductase